MEPKTEKNLVTIDLIALNRDIPDLDLGRLQAEAAQLLMASLGISSRVASPVYKPIPKPVDRRWARTTERIMLR